MLKVKVVVAAIVVIVITILIILIGTTPQEPIHIGPVYETDEATKNIIKQIIDNEYDGDVTISDQMIHQDPCEICDENECNTEEFECWKVNITQDGVPYEVSVTKDSSGGGGGASGDVYKSPPEPTECRNYYQLSDSQNTFDYYNNDCWPPLPTCDSTEELCRLCNSGNDCIRSEIKTDKITGLTLYKYNVIGTVYNGRYDESDSSCIIDDSTIIIYQNTPSTFEECRDQIFSHSECDEDGVCKFI